MIVYIRNTDAALSHQDCQKLGKKRDNYWRHWRRFSAAFNVECEFSCDDEALGEKWGDVM